jgi:hypothetical protein
MADAAFYRSRSFWLQMLGDPCEPRPALDDDRDADVAIIGAGYTGLWTAYYLSELDPWLRMSFRAASPGSERRAATAAGARPLPTSSAKLAARRGRTARWRCTGPWSTPRRVSRHRQGRHRLPLRQGHPHAVDGAAPDRPGQAEIAAEHDLGPPRRRALARAVRAQDVLAVEGRGAAAARTAPPPSGPARAGPARWSRRAASIYERRPCWRSARRWCAPRGAQCGASRGPGHRGVHGHPPVSAAMAPSTP